MHDRMPRSPHATFVMLLALLGSGCSASGLDDGPADRGDPTPGPANATLVADYGGACWIDRAGAVSCDFPGVNVSGLETGVKALYGSPCAFGSCAEKTDGSFYCWDELGKFPDPPDPPALVTMPGHAIVSVARGAKLICTLADDGSVGCSGDYDGEGDTTELGVAADGSPTGLVGKRATQIAAGTGHACAVIDDGTVTCWGNDGHGELGAMGSAPDAVPGIDGTVAEVGAGLHFSCARTDEGAVYCWGTMLPDDGNPMIPPTLVADLPPVIDMGVAEHNVCARAYDDSVWCWGDDLGGQSGVVPEVRSVPPTRLVGITGKVIELAPSSIGYYARTTDGKVWAWGITGPSQDLSPKVISD